MPRITLTRIYQVMAFICMAIAIADTLWVLSGLIHHDISQTNLQLQVIAGLVFVILSYVFLGLADKAKRKPEEE